MKKKKNPEKPLFLFLILASSLASTATAKSTIEPCSSKDTCNSLLGYTLYTDLKVTEVASLFQVDPVSMLLSNSIDISYPDVENHLLPAKLFLKIPITCSCVDGIRKSLSTHYKTRTSDTLGSIADSVYGTKLVIPLPCACFNGTDDSLPALYLSYVVRGIDTMAGIAKRFSTSVSDLTNVNAMGAPDINPGDILAVPLLACSSNFPKYATDYGLIIPNGSYALTAGHCVQCSCVLGSRSMYCEPASLAVSCSSMRCRNSNFMLGNISSQQSSSGCKLTTCSYNGFVSGTILTTLSMSLQPRCPGPQQLAPLIAPPDSVPKELMYLPSPSPSPSPPPDSDDDVVGGGIITAPAASPRGLTVPSSSSIPGNPANGPGGSISVASCPSSYYSFIAFLISIASCFFVFLV
ncbi:PREDICTED: lysM domain-containing GPI-anchored protein 2 isoform X2 [Camelina sativa]|uniref:LysM domain-containing GPI-anchored protein 2 isoform X2 n=1 Tax=Camelina sativa TaxID=90675 RepID=A0ABM0SVG2_CAMSA|nr:PREDICTED: lysM domain-containing GPI-anchored protein 2 isoform X2 [Camelina sativa]